MSSAIKIAILLASWSVSGLAASPLLRVCADPNNLPFSNDQEQGFENQLARLIANDLGMQVSYTWFPQRGKFFQRTLSAGVCDVVMGVAAGVEDVGTTQPYYRSGYVFVSRRDRNLNIHSLNDLRLHQLRIGAHVLGDGDSSLPPVRILTSRGMARNLVGYSIFGTLEESNPAADLIKAVEQGDVDIAVAWGPLAGYFSLHSSTPLDVVSIDPDPQNPSLPLAFDIAIGVRPKDREFKQRLDADLVRRHDEINRLLQNYGIPLGAPEAR